MTSSHEPMRTCLGCRQRRPKGEMVRLVRRTSGHVDADGAADGRGAYVCAELECLERALKPGRLAHAFRKPSEARANLTDIVVPRR